MLNQTENGERYIKMLQALTNNTEGVDEIGLKELFEQLGVSVDEGFQTFGWLSRHGFARISVKATNSGRDFLVRKTGGG
jgi:hypothetical protein